LSRVALEVWSDYLCPWCNVAATRLHAIEQEFAGSVELSWKSYLLRPAPEPNRDFEKFVKYTQGWKRAAEEEPAAEFRVWSSGEGPPSHSVPAHLVAKAAATLGPAEFARVHRALLHAYFAESRDISNARTLTAIWAECALPPGELQRVTDPELMARIASEHNEAVEMGVGGVPAVRMLGNDVAITGAQPLEIYRRWVHRALEA